MTDAGAILLRADLTSAPGGATTGNVSISLATPSTFGEFGSAADARVMQFALRYQF